VADVVNATDDPNNRKTSAIDMAARTVAYLEFDQIATETTSIEGAKVECQLYYKLPGHDSYLPKVTATKTGTGFLVRTDPVVYVATAKHLVKNANAGRYWINPIAGKVEQGTFEDIGKELQGARWFLHEQSDIAVHPIVSEQRHTFTHAHNLSTEPMELLTRVCIPGFPHQLGKDNIRLGPLVATAEIISWPALLPGRAPGAKVVFLSERLAKGYSGAPVYTLRDPPSRGILSKHTMRLAGIQSGFFVFPQPTAKPEMMALDELSYIVPVSYLRELLNSEDVRAFEAGLLQRERASRKAAQRLLGTATY
jgi:hypothetical protein